MVDMRQSGGGKIRIVFVGPARGLIGYLSEFRTDTRGTGIMNRIFHSYAPYKGPIEKQRNGVLISMEDGDATGYALFNLADRGIMFIDHGTKVYKGMIIGEHSKDNDLEVNPIRGKQLTNVRAAGKDDSIKLPPPKKIILEEAISYIEDDELIEVTPKAIRIRKRYLDPNLRVRMMKKDKA
jgi:GTP-binding protein